REVRQAEPAVRGELEDPSRRAELDIGLVVSPGLQGDPTDAAGKDRRPGVPVLEAVAAPPPPAWLRIEDPAGAARRCGRSREQPVLIVDAELIARGGERIAELGHVGGSSPLPAPEELQSADALLIPDRDRRPPWHEPQTAAGERRERAAEDGLRLARGRASVAGGRVAVVALLVALRLDDPVAARHRVADALLRDALVL